MLEDVKEFVKNHLLTLGFSEIDIDFGESLESLNVDSLDVVEMVMAIEEAFEVSLKEGPFQEASTLNEICEIAVKQMESADEYV